MTRTQIRSFLESGVTAINPHIFFGSGRISEWNSKGADTDTEVWWESITEAVGVDMINSVSPNDGWPINLHIGRKDSMDSLPGKYEQIIDDCDYIAQQLTNQYNLVIQDSDTITLTGISRQPFVKKHGGLLFSGVTLSFSLNGPDKTDLC
jgi:hypothetical protein